MSEEAEAFDLDSTLIRRGVNASTLEEMAEFAETVEHRPVEKLLRELPGIAALSDVKFHVAREVIRRRTRFLGNRQREQLRQLAEEIAETAPDPIADRIRDLFV